jgi:ATP-dependent protease ClpP protease subunit
LDNSSGAGLSLFILASLTVKFIDYIVLAGSGSLQGLYFRLNAEGAMTRPEVAAALRSIHKRRKIDFPKVVTEASARQFIARLKRMCRSPKPLQIDFDSRGGETGAGLRISKAIEECGQERIIGRVKRADSAALLALQKCGLRVGRPRSKYGVHASWRPLSELVVSAYTPIDAEWERGVREVAQNAELILRRIWEKEAHHILLEKVMQTGKTEDELRKLYRGVHVMHAREALEWGLIDDIIGGA